MPRWRVDIIRKRAEHLGTVEAANEKEAIEKAAERFDIPPERHNRIAVQKSARIRISAPG
jgi:1,2-phenylacetyl-CoA epoxidase PaaB subunit